MSPLLLPLQMIFMFAGWVDRKEQRGVVGIVRQNRKDPEAGC